MRSIRYDKKITKIGIAQAEQKNDDIYCDKVYTGKRRCHPCTSGAYNMTTIASLDNDITASPNHKKVE
jgi:hypothetical protein